MCLQAVGAVLLVFSHATLPVTLWYHPTAATNRFGHSVAATLLWSMSTDMCGPLSPHKYRIRVTYSAVAIWKELLGVVAKPFYTGQEVLVREIVSHALSTREKLRLLQADTG